MHGKGTMREPALKDSEQKSKRECGSDVILGTERQKQKRCVPLRRKSRACFGSQGEGEATVRTEAVDSGCRCFMACANPCRSNYKLPS